ncbi:MAG TPA: RNA 2',3'-cyclic phosphodiesterase [Actinomycetota bacterium]|nr:RNA 2',3'-cyclic phosphodiesterase [Actinomycetota bacterium]
MTDPERIRLFVAARIPSDRLDAVAALVEDLRDKLSNARWTPPANQHLTLKFLGSTPVDRLGAIEKVCTMVASSHAPARMSLTDLGAFPSRTRIRVLWIGVDDPAGLLAAVAGDLDRSFESLGFPSEGRAYQPHLTLARFKMPIPLKSGFPSVDTTGIEPFDVNEIVLYRSHVSPKGARYEVLCAFPLGSTR